MLTITLEETELYDEETSTFTTLSGVTLELEHSLISLSKWESKHNVPFLTDKERTSDQIIDYLGMMIITPGIDPAIIHRCSTKDLETIQNYIDAKQSATTFMETPGRGGPKEVITAELIYFWMVNFGIPFECQHWHLNRLFALIRICNIKNSDQKKLSPAEIAARNRQLNAERKKELNTTG